MNGNILEIRHRREGIEISGIDLAGVCNHDSRRAVEGAEGVA